MVAELRGAVVRVRMFKEARGAATGSGLSQVAKKIEELFQEMEGENSLAGPFSCRADLGEQQAGGELKKPNKNQTADI